MGEIWDLLASIGLEDSHRKDIGLGNILIE
jgi:hypothetical protein